jgi:hypothetical protein
MKPIRFILLLTFVITLFCVQAIGQNLRMEKSFWGTKLYNDNQQLRPREVLELMKPDSAAYAEFKKAKSNNDAAQVLGFIGGALIGWPIGTAIGGGDPEWGLAAGGAALILLAIPLGNGFNKHAAKAIEIYNGNKGSARNVSLGIVPYGTGVKLVLRF